MKSFKQLLSLTLNGKKKAPGQVFPDEEVNVVDVIDEVKDLLNARIKSKFNRKVKQSKDKGFIGEQVPKSSLDTLMDKLPSKLFISDLHKKRPSLEERMDKDTEDVPQEPDADNFTSKEDKEYEDHKRKRLKRNLAKPRMVKVNENTTKIFKSRGLNE